jgi:arylamine N-acetyltransferase
MTVTQHKMAAEPPRPAYSREQIASYFERLKLPKEQHIYDVAELGPQDALGYLSLLQKHHLAEIPFENLSLHYSTHHKINVHPHDLFRKIIADNNGRGGYCMENSRLFATLLYSLGFNLYHGGARVRMPDGWTGWSHMVILVTIDSIKYHVDVGFGSDGPLVPMPLERSGTIQPHVKPGRARLQWSNIAGNTDPNQRLWVYQYQRNEESEFEIKYCFTELEFQPNDYAIMNYYTSTSRHIFFTRTIVAEKKLWGDDGELVGNLILGDKNIKWRIHGAKEKDIEFENEADRLDALEKYFGIRFGEAERHGIQGLPSELR